MATTYNPDDTNCAAWWVNEVTDTVRPPTTLAFDTESAMSGAQLTTISTDDASGVIGYSTAWGGYKFKFRVAETPASITQIDIATAIASTGPAFVGAVFYLYIWNANTTSWDGPFAATYTGNNAKTTVGQTDVGGTATDYIDGSGDLHFMIQSSSGGGKGEPTCYYAQCVITASAGAPITRVEESVAATPIPDNSLASTAYGTDYGRVAVGASVDKTFTIYNDGTGDLLLTGSGDDVIVGGADSGIYTVITQPSSSTIAASSSDTFTVRVTPTEVGPKPLTSVSFETNDTATLGALGRWTADLNVTGGTLSIFAAAQMFRRK